MTQYLTGGEVVRRERLLDQITVRSAYQTPLLARLPHESTTSTLTEWVADVPFSSSDAVRNIANPHADSRLEGSAFTFENASYELRLRTICEIKHHGVEMSGTDRSAIMAGMADPWDYRVGKVFTKHLNSIDNTGMYGTGSPVTGNETAASGPITAGNERRTQGLIFNSAVTGLERAHGTTTLPSVVDPYGVNIPADYWSVFHDFDFSAITMDSFYNNIIAPALTAGADMEDAWVYQCGYRVMNRVSRFLIADGGIPINERQRNADDAQGSDYVNMFRLASGNTVIFRTNRWLNETDDTFTAANTDSNTVFTPGSPDDYGTPGTQSRTLYGDQTIIGHEPGSVRWLWYREPAFRNVETSGDYNQLAIVSEFALQVDHPLCVVGAANVLS